METNNFLDKAHFSPKLKTYYGKQKTFQLFRDMTRMLKGKIPEEFSVDVTDKLRTVESEKSGMMTTVIDSDGVVDLQTFLEKYSEKLECPIIYYSKERTENDTAIVMSRLRKFLDAKGLNGKHLITFNFPGDRTELLECNSAGFSPNNVIKVIPKLPKQNIESENVNRLNEVEAFFENTTTAQTTCVSLTNNFEDDCNRLKNAIKQYVHKQNPDRGIGAYLQRIVLMGNMGSGRKTQAQLLAQRWHIVFLDFRLLILEYAKMHQSFDDLLMKATHLRQLSRTLIASILLKRITKRDCLEKGWVLVGYPDSVADLEIMEKYFFIIPNKIVFIHCRQRLCMERLRSKIIKSLDDYDYYSPDNKYAKLGFLNLYSPACCVINRIRKEMDYFSNNRRAILQYCQNEKKDIIHVNGEHSVLTVATELWGRIEKFNM